MHLTSGVDLNAHAQSTIHQPAIFQYGMPSIGSLPGLVCSVK